MVGDADDRRKDGSSTPKPFLLDGKGHFVIKTLREGGKYLDGCVHANGKFGRSFGYYVARVRMQRRPGHWSCFWVFSDGVKKIGTNGGRQRDRYVTKTWLDDQFSTAFTGTGTSRSVNGSSSGSCPSVMEGFRTFGVSSKEDEYIFYVNGKETWRRSGGPSAGCRNTFD